MRGSAEQRKIERRLRKRWRQEFKTDRTRRKRRKGTSGESRNSLQVVFTKFRYVLWLLAFLPFPAAWMMAVFFALYFTIFRAVALGSRGMEEAMVALYGGSDREIRALSRRIRWRFAVLSTLDATGVLTVWWLSGRAPWWAVILGVSSYVAADFVGTCAAMRFIPRQALAGALAILNLGGYFFLILERHEPTPVLESLIWGVGALCPGGWTVIMLRECLAGHWELLGILPLLIYGAFQALLIVRGEESRLLALADGRQSLRQNLPLAMARSESAITKNEADKSEERDEFARALAFMRSFPAVEFFERMRPAYFKSQRAVVNFAVVLALALNVRFDFFRVEPQLNEILFFISLVTTHILWLPVLGLAGWLQDLVLSVNRVASLFTLYPVSLRETLYWQIRLDLKKTARAMPFLLIGSIGTCLIAFPDDWTQSAGIGLAIGAFFFFKLPVRWCHFATWPLSSRPLSRWSILHWITITLMILALLVEIFIGISLFEVHFALSIVGIFVAAGLTSALLGGICTYIFLCAYELGWRDVVKLPQAKRR